MNAEQKQQIVDYMTAEFGPLYSPYVTEPESWEDIIDEVLSRYALVTDTAV